MTAGSDPLVLDAEHAGLRPGEVGLIWAQDSRRGVGLDGGIPWHVPEDQAHFRRLTSGGAVIMGRATWESLPERFRPLPGRENVVLSATPGYEAPGARVVASLDEALLAAAGRAAWVIGGARVWEAALGLAHLAVVTHVEATVEADTFAPDLQDGWTVAATSPAAGWATSTSGLRFRVVAYRRA